MKKINYVPWVTAIGVVASLAIALPAFAQTASSTHQWGPGPVRLPGVFGTVASISGTTLTVTSKMFVGPRQASSTASAATTYTVDASNAQVYKNNATSTISSVATGDTVMVQGAVSGLDVTATVIRDGVVPMMGGKPGMMGGRGGMGGKGFGHSSSTVSSTSLIKGNGEPVVAGSVTAVSGTTLTITNASNVTYTIDGSSSTIVKNGTSTAISNVAIGDNIVAQGVVNGTSVTASSIIDQGAKMVNASSTPGSGNHGGGGFGGGFLGAIGGFFKHLFGF
jgi:polyisoprenoid-binding protein YceI